VSFLRYFIYIVIGALASSVLGGLFACVVALISPEFVSTLFGRTADGSLVRYAAGVGMIWGLFLGTVVMAFSLLLVTLIHIAGIIRKKSDAQSRS
jgi:ABC-type branched-subunit amino acid transport system permease subunit